MTDREKLIELLTAYYGADPAYYDVDAPSIADHLLANGVVVQEKGEWEMRGGKRYCPVCKERACVTRDSDDFWYTKGTDFCPNCGADMRRRENG